MMFSPSPSPCNKAGVRREGEEQEEEKGEEEALDYTRGTVSRGRVMTPEQIISQCGKRIVFCAVVFSNRISLCWTGRQALR